MLIRYAMQNNPGPIVTHKNNYATQIGGLQVGRLVIVGHRGQGHNPAVEIRLGVLDGDVCVISL
jgi:hypothetical protein